IAIRRRHFRSKIVMKMNSITTDLVGSEPGQLAAGVEIRIVEDTHSCATHVSNFDVAYVDRRARYKDHVTARSFWIFRSDHDVASDIAGMWQKLESARCIARAFMRVLQRCR